jgi:hypothetical protein
MYSYTFEYLPFLTVRSPCFIITLSIGVANDAWHCFCRTSLSGFVNEYLFGAFMPVDVSFSILSVEFNREWLSTGSFEIGRVNKRCSMSSSICCDSRHSRVKSLNMQRSVSFSIVAVGQSRIALKNNKPTNDSDIYRCHTKTWIYFHEIVETVDLIVRWSWCIWKKKNRK